MSALPPEADIRQRIEHVCFVPIADIEHQAQPLLRRPSGAEPFWTNFGASSRRRILWPSSSRSEHLTYEKVSLTELVGFDLL
jgi:hypothetical protein